MIKLISKSKQDLFVKLPNQIYASANIPTDWLESSFIPIPKKSNLRQSNDFRLICLMCILLKLQLHIFHNRIQNKCEKEISKEHRNAFTSRKVSTFVLWTLKRFR